MTPASKSDLLLPGGSEFAKFMAAVGSCCAQTRLMLANAWFFAVPSGRCCAPAIALAASFCAQMEKMELTAAEMTLVSEREAARKNKDFAKADTIRKMLEERGVIIEDTPAGPRITKK